MMPFETRAPADSGFSNIRDAASLWSILEKRFGAEGMRQFRDAMRKAWIDESDFRRIRAAGMNCVRLPFTYDLLEEPGGFSWLDRALDWARKNDLYVVLDLHGAPGRQSDADHTGEAGVNRLFKDPAKVAETETVWKRIARRYRNRPEVAGYDLLNEPMGAPDVATLYVVEDRLYRAVRSEDDRHPIIVEDGYKGRNSFPQPALAGWQNIIFSWHHYDFNARSEEDQAKGLIAAAADAARVREKRSAPLFIGEFQIEPHGTPAALAQGLQAFRRQGASWAIWTYKTAMRRGGGGMWGWHRAADTIRPFDPFRDSLAELIEKSGQLRTSNLIEDPAMTAAFRSATLENDRQP